MTACDLAAAGISGEDALARLTGAFCCILSCIVCMPGTGSERGVTGVCARGWLGSQLSARMSIAAAASLNLTPPPRHTHTHTEPFITRAALLKAFGPQLAPEVAARYLLEGQGPGGFRLRPEWASEKVLCVL